MDPPNVNMWYGLRNAELYDGIQVGTYEALKNDMLATKTLASLPPRQAHGPYRSWGFNTC